MSKQHTQEPLPYYIDVDAPNYLEMAYNHPVAGNITVTIQKEAGKTAHMLRREAEQQRDNLLAALQDAIESCEHELSHGGQICCDLEKMKEAVANAKQGVA